MFAHKLATDAGSLADEWASLHRQARFAVHDCELHYLSTTALSAADDLVAHMLLKKLKLAKKLGRDSAVPVVRMNSVEPTPALEPFKILAREGAPAGLLGFKLT